MKSLLLFAFMLVCLSARAQNHHPFEDEIRAFERADSVSMPAKGQILLYGSSSIRLWNTWKNDLTGYAVVNRGFGGSQFSDAIYYFDRVVMPLAPAWILLYEGDNDLAAGKSPGQTYTDFLKFMDMVEEKLPGTRIGMISVKPSGSRQTLIPQQKELNEMLRRYCKMNPKKARYINVYPVLLDKKGLPDAGLFQKDHLHLNAAGYARWTAVFRKFLKKQVGKPHKHAK